MAVTPLAHRSAWWELDRIQPFAEDPRFWLLGPAPAEPVHVRLAPQPGARLRHRLMWTSRRAWVAVFPAAVMAFLFRDAMSTWLGLLAIPVFPALILVAIAPELAWRAVRTTQKSQEAAATAA